MKHILTLLMTNVFIQESAAFASNEDFRALLTDVQSIELRRGRHTLHTPSNYQERARFGSLLDRSHTKTPSHKSLPKCLTSRKDDLSFLRYDTHCSFTLTPSEYCCSVYAEQACLDPAQPLREAITTVRDRINGLDGRANPFLYDKCMLDNCSAACSVSEGNDVNCKQCATVCQRSCLANLSLLCMRRVCGQNLISFAEGASSMGKESSVQDPSHEWTGDFMKAKVDLPDADIRGIEQQEIIHFVLDILDPSMKVPMCRDSGLVSADRSAGVFTQSGRTYIDALLGCTRNILAPHKLSAIVSDPDLLRSDEDCSTVARCERNHESLAVDRANAQLQIIRDKVASSSSSR